jgi:tetratricopeptide (TPR) repeat protein
MPPSPRPDSSKPSLAIAGVPPDQIDSALARIVASAPFHRSPRHQRLLRHLVANALAGNARALKEALVAHEVFGRPLASFDPARDTIVRVEARRLRQRLERYYATEGRDDRLEIRLPVGSYVPAIFRRETHSPAATRRAQDLTERGEYLLRQPLSQANLEQARERFDAALHESPAYVPALVGLGRAWFNLAIGWYVEPRPAAEHAAEALRHALALDAGHAVAHALLGAIKHQFEYDWPAARANFERAVALAPDQAFVHSAYGCHLYSRGEFDAAERELKIARRLDPHYANARMHMVNLRIAQGRLADAQAEVDALLDIAPDNMPALGLRGLIAQLRGDAAAAVALFRRVCELAPDHPNAHASLASALALAGDRAGAEAVLQELTRRFGHATLSPYVLAIAAVRSGRVDDAFALLEDGLARHDPSMMLLRTDPCFAGLHADPRWHALLARLVPEVPFAPD